MSSTLHNITAVGLAVTLLVANPRHVSAADLWKGFYRPTNDWAATSWPSKSPKDLCISEILRAQQRYGIPDNLLLAIGFLEAGRKLENRVTIWPWTVNANGDGRFFKSRESALKWALARKKSGITSIDVGCMQLNQKWHSAEFNGYADAMIPARNVDYAARFLVSLYRITGDWNKAAGRYHSRTKSHQATYLKRLRANSKFIRANFASMTKPAPATKTSATLPVQTSTPLLWSAALSRSSAKKVAGYGLYSTKAIKPLLPNYKKGS